MNGTTDDKELRARIEKLEAETARDIEETRKARFEQSPWRHPSTWILMCGTLGGVGTAIFQWQKADVEAERAALAADRANDLLDQRTRELGEVSGQLSNQLASVEIAKATLGELSRRRVETEKELDEAKGRIARLTATEGEKRQLLKDLEIAEEHDRRIAEAAKKALEQISQAQASRPLDGMVTVVPNFISLGILNGGQAISRTIRITRYDPGLDLASATVSFRARNPAEEWTLSQYFKASLSVVDADAVDVKVDCLGLPLTHDGTFSGYCVVRLPGPQGGMLQIALTGVHRK